LGAYALGEGVRGCTSTLCSKIKSGLFSTNLDQIMPKNGLFFRKKF